MGFLLSLSRAGALITSFLLPSLEAALRIKSLFELDPDYTVNLYTLTGAALTADDQTLAIINAWRASKGLEPLPAEIPPLTPGTAIAMPVMIMGPNPAPASPAGPTPPQS